MQDMSSRKLKALLATLFATLGATLSLAAPAAPLKVGGFVVAPLIMGQATAPLQGALRAYVEQEVVKRAGIELVWTPPTSIPRAMENLRTGVIDILLLTSGRIDTPGVIPTTWHYLRTQPHLAVLKTSPLQSVQSLRQLAGMDVGWAGGTLVPPPLADIPIQWQLLTVQDWQTANLRKLKMGRIQAVFFENEYSPRYYAAEENMDIHLVKLPMPERHFTMAYSPRSDKETLAQFDKAAATAFANDQFKAFLEQYMKR
jgi:ABC-type amino acid transport substrate-binding protein